MKLRESMDRMIWHVSLFTGSARFREFFQQWRQMSSMRGDHRRLLMDRFRRAGAMWLGSSANKALEIWKGVVQNIKVCARERVHDMNRVATAQLHHCIACTPSVFALGTRLPFPSLNNAWHTYHTCDNRWCSGRALNPKP